MRRSLHVAALVLPAAVVLSACSGYQPGAQVRNGGVLVVALPADPVSLNPLTAGDVASVRAYTPLFPALYAVAPDLTLRPDLAAALPVVSGDGRTVTVALREGARWSDGVAITGADVVYTVTTERDPSLSGDGTAEWTEVDHIDAPDALHVRFTLHGADASFAADHLVTAVVPAHALAATKPQEMAQSFFATTPTVTGGPFRLISRDSQHHLIRLGANPAYYGGRPHLDEIDEVVVPHDSRGSVPGSIAQGQYLFVPGLARDLAAAARDLREVRLQASGELDEVALVMNARSGQPTSDVAVRRAVARAIDRTAVTRAAMGDAATPLWQDLPRQSWAFDPTAVPETGGDPAAARALLVADGWNGAASDVLTRGGAPLALDCIFPRGDTARAAAAAALSGELRAAGIAVHTTAVEPTQLTGDLASGAFTLALVARGTGIDPDDSRTVGTTAIPATGLTPAMQNVGGFSDPQVDAALAADRAVTGNDATARAARRAAIATRERRLADQVPFVTLWQPQRFDAFNVTVGGVEPGAQLDQDRDPAMYARWYLSA